MFRLWKKEKVPDDQKDVFERLKMSGLCISKDVPLMPVVDVRGFRHGLRMMKKARLLKAGANIVFLSMKVKRGVPWYRVQLRGTWLVGWINSAALLADKGYQNAIVEGA